MPDPVQVGSLVVHRHDMAWVDRDNGWRIIDQFANRGIRALLHDWIAARFPFVVRRQSECGARAPDVLALGLALPPLAGKQRIALEVPANAIARIAPAPALEEVSERITAHSRAPLLLLQELAMQSRVEFRVFGSAAWEALTGLAYLSNQSDLDLLWQFLNGGSGRQASMPMERLSSPSMRRSRGASGATAATPHRCW